MGDKDEDDGGELRNDSGSALDIDIAAAALVLLDSLSCLSLALDAQDFAARSGSGSDSDDGALFLFEFPSDDVGPEGGAKRMEKDEGARAQDTHGNRARQQRVVVRAAHGSIGWLVGWFGGPPRLHSCTASSIEIASSKFAAAGRRPVRDVDSPAAAQLKVATTPGRRSTITALPSPSSGTLSMLEPPMPQLPHDAKGERQSSA